MQPELRHTTTYTSQLRSHIINSIQIIKILNCSHIAIHLSTPKTYTRHTSKSKPSEGTTKYHCASDPHPPLISKLNNKEPRLTSGSADM